MKNLPIKTIRKVIWHGHFYYIISYFIILQKNIDILLAGLVKYSLSEIINIITAYLKVKTILGLLTIM
jgi:hypothetical protein